MHGQPGCRDVRGIENAGTDDPVPGNASLLREVVVERTETGEQGAQSGNHFSRGKAVFTAQRVASRHAVTALEHLVNANRALIVDVVFVSDVHVIVAIGAGADHGRRTHHGTAARCRARVHDHVRVGPRHMIQQEFLRYRTDQVCRDNVVDTVVLKLVANNLRIAGADRPGWIKTWIGM